jgi:hypothetical protein
MDEMLKEAGKTMLALANLSLILFFVNHYLLGNLNVDTGVVALVFYGETFLYLTGLYLVKKGRDLEKKEKNG